MKEEVKIQDLTNPTSQVFFRNFEIEFDKKVVNDLLNERFKYKCLNNKSAKNAPENAKSDDFLIRNIFVNSLDTFYSKILGEAFFKEFFGFLTNWHAKKEDVKKMMLTLIKNENEKIESESFNDFIAEFHKIFIELTASEFFKTRPYKMTPRANKKKLPIDRFYHTNNSFAIEIKSRKSRGPNGEYPANDFLLIYSN